MAAGEGPKTFSFGAFFLAAHQVFFGFGNNLFWCVGDKFLVV